MKIFINISTFIGMCGNASHYYGKIRINDTNENIYLLCKNADYGDFSKIADELRRVIDQKEAIFLNEKDGKGSRWVEGMETSRFNSIEELKKTAKLLYPDNDIAFLKNWTLQNENMDIIIQTKEKIVKTGQQLKIKNFKGFSPNFKNLIEDSIHDIIETPERYKKTNLQKGYWVNGVYEPALVLICECILNDVS